MKRSPFSFKISTNKDQIDPLCLRTNKRSEKGTPLMNSSRTTLPKDKSQTHTRNSSNAFSSSYKNSIQINTNQSENSQRTESLKKQQTVGIDHATAKEAAKTMNVCQAKRKRTYTLNSQESTNYKTLNTQCSDYADRTGRKVMPYNNQNSPSKIQFGNNKNNEFKNSFEGQIDNKCNESQLQQLNLASTESKEVFTSFQQLPTELDLQLELDIEDFHVPNLIELRKRLDSQFRSSRDILIQSDISPVEKLQTREKLFSQSNQIDQIIGDAFSTFNNSFECSEKNVGVEINMKERSLEDKIKQNSLNVPSSFTNEINIYSSLQYKLQKRNIDPSAIQKKLQEVFKTNQQQKKKEESINSVFLIDNSRIDKLKYQSSTNQTISIVILDKIDEDDDQSSVLLSPQNNLNPDSQAQNLMHTTNRCSIFLNKNVNMQQDLQKVETLNKQILKKPLHRYSATSSDLKFLKLNNIPVTKNKQVNIQRINR